MSMRLVVWRMSLLLCILACAPVRPKYLLQEYLLTLDGVTAVAPFHEMSGTIPANIGARFPMLKQLILDGTAVSGTLPQQLLMHPELRLISLSRTRALSGACCPPHGRVRVWYRFGECTRGRGGRPRTNATCPPPRYPAPGPRHPSPCVPYPLSPYLHLNPHNPPLIPPRARTLALSSPRQDARPYPRQPPQAGNVQDRAHTHQRHVPCLRGQPPVTHLLHVQRTKCTFGGFTQCILAGPLRDAPERLQVNGEWGCAGGGNDSCHNDSFHLPPFTKDTHTHYIHTYSRARARALSLALSLSLSVTHTHTHTHTHLSTQPTHQADQTRHTTDPYIGHPPPLPIRSRPRVPARDIQPEAWRRRPRNEQTAEIAVRFPT